MRKCVPLCSLHGAQQSNDWIHSLNENLDCVLIGSLPSDNKADGMTMLSEATSAEIEDCFHRV